MLAPDIITEILWRLPPKSNIRFRSVSKWLCSEIDDPKFAKLHYSCSLKSCSRQVLTYSIYGDFKLFDNLFTVAAKPMRVEHLTVPVVIFTRESETFFYGSCRGLIALSSGDNVIIWNPYTRKHWFPPAPHILYPEAKRFTIFGFGYDSLSDDYKLVRIDWYLSFDVPMNYDVMVYSFKSRSWRHISDLPKLLIILLGYRHSVFAHDSLHFVTVGSGIVAFNTHTEQFRSLVELPSLRDRVDAKLVDLTVLGGQLCAVLKLRSSEMEVWTIKDYGGKDESWTKLFRTPVSLDWCKILVTPLDYSESGNKVLLHYNKFDKCGFSWIDLESWKVEKDKSGKCSCCFRDATVLIASMVSLD